MLSKTTHLSDSTDEIPCFRMLRAAYDAHQNSDSTDKILITLSNAILTHQRGAVGLSRRALVKLCAEDLNWKIKPGVDNNNYQNILWCAYQTLWKLVYRMPGRRPSIFAVTQEELLIEMNLSDEQLQQQILEAKEFISSNKSKNSSDHKSDIVSENIVSEDIVFKNPETKESAKENLSIQITDVKESEIDNSKIKVPVKVIGDEMMDFKYDPKEQDCSSSNNKNVSLIDLSVLDGTKNLVHSKSDAPLLPKDLILGTHYYTPKDDALAVLVGKRVALDDYLRDFIDLAGQGIVFSHAQLNLMKNYALKAVLKKTFHVDSARSKFSRYWENVERFHKDGLDGLLCAPEMFSISKAMRVEEEWLDSKEDPDLVWTAVKKL